MQRLKTTVKVTESVRFSAAGTNKFKRFYFCFGLIRSQQMMEVS
jgi:hypothetical protein